MSLTPLELQSLKAEPFPHLVLYTHGLTSGKWGADPHPRNLKWMQKQAYYQAGKGTPM